MGATASSAGKVVASQIVGRAVRGGAKNIAKGISRGAGKIAKGAKRTGAKISKGVKGGIVQAKALPSALGKALEKDRSAMNIIKQAQKQGIPVSKSLGQRLSSAGSSVSKDLKRAKGISQLRDLGSTLRGAGTTKNILSGISKGAKSARPTTKLGKIKASIGRGIRQMRETGGGALDTGSELAKDQIIGRGVIGGAGLLGTGGLTTGSVILGNKLSK